MLNGHQPPGGHGWPSKLESTTRKSYGARLSSPSAGTRIESTVPTKGQDDRQNLLINTKHPHEDRADSWALPSEKRCPDVQRQSDLPESGSVDGGFQESDNGYQPSLADPTQPIPQQSLHLRGKKRLSGTSLAPEFSAISQEQLAAEVKDIYAGLVTIEAKCIDIDDQLKATQPGGLPLSTEQWQRLVALHRTLLYEHHDFLMATQTHNSVDPALVSLATKYSIPARLWKHGIHAFLEVLRSQPSSQEYMLAYIYLAYQMISLLLETVPSFTDTWIECLGDLARYRMAIEEDREVHNVWGGVAGRWYVKAADRHPQAGRLYHHSGILERPSLRKFYLYGRSLTSAVPFSGGVAGRWYMKPGLSCHHSNNLGRAHLHETYSNRGVVASGEQAGVVDSREAAELVQATAAGHSHQQKFHLYGGALTSVVPFSDANELFEAPCTPGKPLPHAKSSSINTNLRQDPPQFHSVASPETPRTTFGGADEGPESAVVYDRLIIFSSPQNDNRVDNVKEVNFLSRHGTATASAGIGEIVLRNASPDPRWAAPDTSPRASFGGLSRVPTTVRRLVYEILDRLACHQRHVLLRSQRIHSLLSLSTVLYIANSIPRACAAPVTGEQGQGIEAGLQKFWRNALTLAPWVVVVGGTCRVAWILFKPNRPLEPPIWSGAMSLIASSVWGVARTAETAFTKEQAVILAINGAILAGFVADFNRLMNNKARYLMGVALGGSLITLALLTLYFIVALENGQADDRSKYMTQAVNKGPFLLTSVTLGISWCQKYLECTPTANRPRNSHEEHELQVLRTD